MAGPGCQPMGQSLNPHEAWQTAVMHCSSGRDKEPSLPGKQLQEFQGRETQLSREVSKTGLAGHSNMIFNSMTKMRNNLI